MSDDPQYVAARRVLLDALEALRPHGRAVIVAGAQAIYLRTGASDLGIAPYTTDGDIALDPSLLDDEPALADAMYAAGFRLTEPLPGRPEPGIWVAQAIADGRLVAIPVDLIVPDAVAPPGGRRSARLPKHGRHAARRIAGLEAALVDHGPVLVAALDPTDQRAFEVEVAGVAALFVAKIHKIHDRLAEVRAGRLEDKDAADVYRLMQTSRPLEIGATLRVLAVDPTAGASTRSALARLAPLFGQRNGPGVEMAVRALRLAVPDAQVRAVCVEYVERLLQAVERV